VPYYEIVKALETYPNSEVMYCQEEPVNGQQIFFPILIHAFGYLPSTLHDIPNELRAVVNALGGAYSYLAPRLENAMNQTKDHAGKKVLYAGRPPCKCSSCWFSPDGSTWLMFCCVCRCVGGYWL
jgi:2-oxoglutarate dehydrogenase E1 component